MSYPALLDKEFTLSSYFIENDHFVAHLNLDIQIPVSCNYEKSGISLTLDHSNAILTCPLENGHLKHYLKDYKNYYYLPMEDLVIHKSMKSFVDTTSIIRADKTIVIQNLLQEIASYLQKLMLPIIVLTLFITFYLKIK